MSAIFFLICISLTVALGFLAIFIWAIGNGQYEDDYTPSVRMLFDDTPQPTSTEPESSDLPSTANKAL